MMIIDNDGQLCSRERRRITFDKHVKEDKVGINSPVTAEIYLERQRFV